MVWDDRRIFTTPRRYTQLITTTATPVISTSTVAKEMEEETEFPSAVEWYRKLKREQDIEIDEDVMNEELAYLYPPSPSQSRYLVAIDISVWWNGITSLIMIVTTLCWLHWTDFRRTYRTKNVPSSSVRVALISVDIINQFWLRRKQRKWYTTKA